MNEQYTPTLMCRVFGHKWEGNFDCWEQNPGTEVYEEFHTKRNLSHCRRCGIPNPAFVSDEPES